MESYSVAIELVIYLAEMAIAMYYSNVFFISGKSMAKKWIVWIIGYMTLYGVFYFNITWLNILLFLIVNSIIIIYIYDPGYVSGIFHAVILTAIMTLSESVVVVFFSFAATEFRETMNYNVEAVIAAVMSKIVYFIIVCILRFLFKGVNEKSSEGYKLLFVPLVTVGLFYLFVSICWNYTLDNADQILLSVGSVSLLLINILVFWEREKIIERGRQNAELNLQIQKEKDMAEYYRLMLRRDEEIKIIVHDYKKHLQALKILNEAYDNVEIKNYVESILGKIDVSSKKYSENKLVDAILTRYAELSSNNGISFSADVRKGAIGFISNEDVTALLGNIVENSYEAAKQFQGENAFIDISINRSAGTDEVAIVAINSCNKDPHDNHGEMHTIKKKKGFHGFGMKSIKRTITKYNGDMITYYSSDEEAFHLVIKLCCPTTNS